MFNRMRAATFVTLLLATTSPVITNNTAVAQTQSPTKIASTVIATANGQQLTQSMVNWYIEFGEFLAGHKFSQGEKSWIRDVAIKDFRKNPTDEIQAYRDIEKVLSTIRKYSQNPVKLAKVREKVMAAVHLKLFTKNKVNKSSMMTIVYKYSPVLYTNPKYKIVVTKRTVDALNASRNFVAKIAGKPIVKPDYRRWKQAFEQENPKDFSPQGIRNLLTAESRWVGLQVALSKASPRQRRKIINHIKRLMQKRGRTLSYIARNLESEVPKFVLMGEVRVPPSLYQYITPRINNIYNSGGAI